MGALARLPTSASHDPGRRDRRHALRRGHARAVPAHLGAPRRGRGRAPARRRPHEPGHGGAGERVTEASATKLHDSLASLRGADHRIALLHYSPVKVTLAGSGSRSTRSSAASGSPRRSTPPGRTSSACCSQTVTPSTGSACSAASPARSREPLLAALMTLYAWVAPGRARTLPPWLWRRLGLRPPGPGGAPDRFRSPRRSTPPGRTSSACCSQTVTPSTGSACSAASPARSREPLLAALMTLYAWVAPGRARTLPPWLWRRLGLRPPGPGGAPDRFRIDRLDTRPWFSPARE